MARFPKIDSPCPLGIEEQLRINGYCQRCDKHVHAIDGMSDEERRALLANASGPICVSYRRGSRLASVAAIAITLVAGTAFAGENCADAAAVPGLVPPTQQPVAAASPVAPRPVIADAKAEPEPALSELDLVAITGGISTPHDADWIDDSDLPELPMQSHAQLTEVPPSASPAQPVSGRD